MAFEVFDDVAFYWFLMAVLSLFVIPMSQSFYGVLPRLRGPLPDWTRGISSCKEKFARVYSEERKLMMSRVFGWRCVGFVVGETHSAGIYPIASSEPST